MGTRGVDVLLSAGLRPDSDDRWPVLYLLHGANDDHSSWTRETDVATLTEQLGVLVAMPDAGTLGFYSDWWNGGRDGPPMWETFHIVELAQLSERNWQAGPVRAAAGLSMGGFGSMSYAARHPGHFRAVASFSGVLHTLGDGLDVPPDLWGRRDEQSDVWDAHDPLRLAHRLRGVALYVSYGDGNPGPLDTAGTSHDALESTLCVMNETFVARLAELAISATVNAYGRGTHTWPYWKRGLHDALPLLLDGLGSQALA